MIEDKELWMTCLGSTALIITIIKAFIIAGNPYLNGTPSHWNAYQGSQSFMVRFIYDFISSFFNIMYLLFFVVPVSLAAYGICRFFM